MNKVKNKIIFHLIIILSIIVSIIGCQTKLEPPSLPQRHLNMLRSETLFLVLKYYKDYPDVVDSFVEADKLLKEGKWDLAEKQYKSIIYKYPFGQQTYLSRFWVAVCYEYQGKDDLALKMYQTLKNSDTLLGKEARRRARILQ